MQPNSPSLGPSSPEAGQNRQNFEAPAISPETSSVESVQMPAPVEVDRPAGESANQNAGMQPIVVADPYAAPPQTPVSDPVATSSVSQVLQSAPQVANDVDVIEKEWVDKAKQIVHDSLDDPFKQNHNVSILKADYMKKRYGKDIKIPDDPIGN